jgi:hypothetical protein
MHLAVCPGFTSQPARVFMEAAGLHPRTTRGSAVVAPRNSLQDKELQRTDYRDHTVYRVLVKD